MLMQSSCVTKVIEATSMRRYSLISTPLSMVRVRIGWGCLRSSWMARRAKATAVGRRSFPIATNPVARSTAVRMQSPPTLPNDGIELPVSNRPAGLHVGGSLVNRPPPQPWARTSPTPPPPLAPTLPKVAPERERGAALPMQPEVDRLPTDLEDPRRTEPARDLLRAPVLLQAGADTGPVVGRQSLIAP
jgi:hypothetical protein